MPSGGVGEVEISQRKMGRTTPEGRTTYAPMPGLIEGRKRELEAMVDQQVIASPLHRLARYGSSGTMVEVRRCLGVLGSFLFLAGRWVRWVLRARARSGGLCGVILLVYEGLSHWGVFGGIQAPADQARGLYKAMHDARPLDRVKRERRRVRWLRRVHVWRGRGLPGPGNCWPLHRVRASSRSSGTKSEVPQVLDLHHRRLRPRRHRTPPRQLLRCSMANALDRQQKLLERLTSRQSDFEEKLVESWESNRAKELCEAGADGAAGSNGVAAAATAGRTSPGRQPASGPERPSAQLRPRTLSGKCPRTCGSCICLPKQHRHIGIPHVVTHRSCRVCVR